MELTKQERALIELVRGLCFEDLLDATEGIRKESEKAAEQAIIASKKGETINSTDFKERAETCCILLMFWERQTRTSVIISARKKST